MSLRGVQMLLALKAVRERKGYAFYDSTRKFPWCDSPWNPCLGVDMAFPRRP